MADRAKFAPLADIDCGELLAKLFGGAARNVRAQHLAEPAVMRILRFWSHDATNSDLAHQLTRFSPHQLMAQINTPFSYYGPTLSNTLVTPLMWACLERNVGLVRLILKLGGDPNYSTGTSLVKCPSAFHLACNGGILGDYCVPILGELLKAKIPETVRWEGDNATSLLHYTVMTARTDPVEVLRVLLPTTSPLTTSHLNSVIDMPCNAAGGSTALYMATMYGWTESVAFLLKAGANPNVLDEEGCSSLMYALSANQGATIMELLNHGANPDIVTLDGRHTRSFIEVESTRYLLERFLSEGTKPRQRPVVQYSKAIKPKPPATAAGATKPPMANTGTSLRDAMTAHYYKRLEEDSAAGDVRATRAIAMQKAAGIYPAEFLRAHSAAKASTAATPHVPRGVETVMMTTAGPDGVKKQVEVEIEEVSMEEMAKLATEHRAKREKELKALNDAIDAQYTAGYPQLSKVTPPPVAIAPAKVAAQPPAPGNDPDWSPAELEWLKTIPPTQDPTQLWYLKQTMGQEAFAREYMQSALFEKSKQPSAVTPTVVGTTVPTKVVTGPLSIEDGPEWSDAEREWLKTLSPPQDAAMLWALKRNIGPDAFARDVMNGNVFTRTASVGVAVPVVTLSPTATGQGNAAPVVSTSARSTKVAKVRTTWCDSCQVSHDDD